MIIVIIFGIVCFVTPAACKCEPDDETPDKKQNTTRNNDNHRNSNDSVDIDTVVIKK